MKIEIKKSTNKEIDFTLKGVEPPFANAIRRVCMMQVPVFGIESVTFYENSSALFDEYIANRIGLVPIKSPEGYTEKDVVLFSLDKAGPCTVYSKHLKSSDPKVAVANGDIPIINLLEGQRLRLEGKAKLGVGRRHAKFQTGLITYEIDKNDGSVFHFHVETFGQMPAKEMLKRGVKVLESKLKKMKKEMEK